MQLSLVKPPQPQQFELRGYQKKAVDDLQAAAIAGHRHILLYLPCAGGKTVISSEVFSRAIAKGRRALFFVHLDTLVGQTHEKIEAAGLHCGFIKAGWPEDRSAPLQIGSLQTMANRRWWRKQPFDLIVGDEVHISRFFNVAQQIIDLNPQALEIGLTATPWRTSAKQGMGDHYDSLVIGPMPSELLSQGHLAPLKYFSLPAADLGGVKKRRGDYDESMLSVVCDRPELTGRAIDEWFRLTPGKRTVAFCVNAHHARSVADAFNARGVPADCVLGGTSPTDRKRLYAALRSGELLVLTSCNVISIGFDEPSVEVGLMMRPTQSAALHFQQLGRIQRLSPATGKTHGTILDQAGNVKRLGPIEHLTESSIALAKGRTSNFGGEAVLKICPTGKEDALGTRGCGHIMLAFCQHCPECGYVFPVENWIEQTGQLEELILGVSDVQRKFFVDKLKACVADERSPGQAQMAFKNRFHGYPKPGHTRRALYDATTKENVEEYFRLLSRIAAKRQKGAKFVKGWMTREFGDTWQPFAPDPDAAFNQLKLAAMVSAIR